MTRGYGLIPEVGRKIFITSFTALLTVSDYPLNEVFGSHVNLRECLGGLVSFNQTCSEKQEFNLEGR